MPKFLYKAKDGPKKIIEGSIEAESEQAALSKLTKIGYFPISIKIEKVGEISSSQKFYLFKKIKLHDLAIFTRQLADLLDSGLTLANALRIIHDQTENKFFKSILSSIRNQVEEGVPFSEAIKLHPKIFSKLYISMSRSGETGGMMGEILNRLADFAETQEQLENKVKAALAYPAVMASVGIVTIFVLITFVIPKIVGMFEDLGQALPLPTTILVNVSDLVINYWYLLLSAIALFVIFFARLKKTKEGQLYIDRIKLGFPVFGQLINKAEIARFSRTLATLLANGVPILESLEVVRDTMQNTVLRKDADGAYALVRDGKSLAVGLSKGKYFPIFITNMIAVGEEGGQLEKALFKVADSYDKQLDNAVKVMTSLLEPILILTMGLVVGFIVISMLLPIFQINIIAR